MVPLPKTQHKVPVVIRAEAPFLALQEHKHLPALLQSFRKEPSSGQGSACTWVFPVFFYFLSLLGSSAFIVQFLSLLSEPLAAIYTSKRSITTNSCWQQLSLSRMRQGAPSYLLTANKCSFPVIPQNMQWCRARLAGLAHCAWGHPRGGRCGRNTPFFTTTHARSLGELWRCGN